MAVSDATVFLLMFVAIAAVAAAAYFYVTVPQPQERVIIRRGGPGPWGPRRWYPWGPYYAHLPVRPLLY
jgi:hypothetical protein